MIDELGYFDDGKKNKQTNDWMNKQTNDYDDDDKNDYYWWGLMTFKQERWDEWVRKSWIQTHTQDVCIQTLLSKKRISRKEKIMAFEVFFQVFNPSIMFYCCCSLFGFKKTLKT